MSLILNFLKSQTNSLSNISKYFIYTNYKNKGGDTFYNNKTTFLTETFDLTVNIEICLTYLEEIEKKISFLRPIGETWGILAPIGAAFLSLIYINKEKKEKERKNNYYNDTEYFD